MMTTAPISPASTTPRLTARPVGHGHGILARAQRFLAGSWVAPFALLFLSPAVHPVAAQTTPTSVETLVADFNHDGIPDLLTLSPTSPTGTIIFGSVPYGTFNSTPTVAIAPTGCVAPSNGAINLGKLIVADFNNDGIPDYFFVCGNSSTSSITINGILLGNGDATFTPSATLNAPYIAGGVAGDFNKDGKLDLVLITYPNGLTGTNTQTPSLLFFAGNGDGTFAAPVSSPLGASATFQPGNYLLSSPVAADVDGDGYPDILLNAAYGYSPTSYTGATLVIAAFGNKKDGTFGVLSQGTRTPDATARVGTYPAVSPLKLLAGHFKSATTSDFVVPDTGTSPGLLFIANTSTPGTFTLTPGTKTVSAGLKNATTAAFTGSGLTDLAVANGTTISALNTNGDGTFSPTYSTLSVPSTATLFTVADANGDGYTDLYTASVTSGSLSASVSLVTGTATATTTPFSLPTGTAALTAVWPGNINFNGSTANGTQTVNGSPVLVALTSSKNPSNVGDSVTLTATVTPTPANTTPLTGTLSIVVDNTLLGQGQPDSTGSLIAATSALLAGAHTVTANYTGDPFYASTPAAPLTQAVNQPAAVAPTLTWAPAPVIVGTALSPTQLNAVATNSTGAVIPGAYVYTPAAGNILSSVGSQVLSVTFTPTDLVTYKVASLSVPITVLPAGRSPLTTNLLLNPGAELGLVNGAIPNWTPAGPGNPTLDSGTFDGGINPHTGSYDFVGFSGPSDSLSQTVSLLTQGVTAALIDAGTVSASLSFWEQGLSQGTPSDDASVTLTFLDGNAATLSSVTTAEVDSHNNAWQNLATSYPVPSGTRSITYTMNFIRHAGSDLDGFVDDNSLVLTTPAPAVPSTTTLTVTSGTAPATTVAQGTPITLTATVLSGTVPATPGQVIFCDAAFPTCTDIHLLGTAQLTSAGTATFTFFPAAGTHTYKAVFLGTTSYIGSTSATASLAVTASYATSASLTATGSVGNYTLTTTVSGTTAAAFPTGTISFVDQTNSNAVLAQAPLTTASRTLSLTQGTTAPTGTEPAFAVNADFNGDGRPDLLIVNNPQTIGAAASKPTILLTNADGTFTSIPGPAILNGSAVTADFNGDGKADFAGPASSGSGISVFLGNGDGTFGTAITATTPANPGNLITGDFNNDGLPDLAVLSFNAQIESTTLTILLGKGDGTFAAGTTTVVPGSGSFAIASADLNADGKADLIITGAYQASSSAPSTYLASILLGKGDGTFTTQPSLSSTNPMQNILAADFNGDGKLDLIFTSPAQDGSVVLNTFLGNADGTFTAQTPATIANTAGANLTSAAIADFNADGVPDLAIATYPRIAILLNNGQGIFTQAASITRGDSDPDYLPIVIADFNGDGVPDIFTTDSDTLTASLTLTERTSTSTAIATNINPLGTGTHQVAASYPGDTLYAGSTSAPATLTATQLTPTLTWTPAVPTITYGTPLGAQQLNAVATTPTSGALPGTYIYTPAPGTVPAVGPLTVSVTFTPISASFTPVTATQTITVTQATPTLAWATPSPIAQGTALSATQLNASATGVGGVALPGTFTYTPAAGTIPAAGTQTLSVLFTPTDSIDYTTATATVRLTVTGLTLTSFTPNTASVGDAAKTITLTGTGFNTGSVVRVNSVSIATTYVNPTTLTAVVPATSFASAGTLAITVSSPATSSTSQALPLTVSAPTPAVTLSGPSTTQPSSQPNLTLSLTNPYPIPLTATFSLSFASNVTPAVDDPAIQFANGGRTYTFTVPANSTTVPTIQIQAGTIAGTITVPLTLTAAGVNVTPTTIQPLTIVVPAAIPAVTTATITRGTSTFTVTVHGFSNTREVATATFHFVPATGSQIDTPDVTIPVAAIFSGWFTSAPSTTYGSTFTYTQIFNVSDTAASIGSVQVTLTNAVGVSTVYTTQ